MGDVVDLDTQRPHCHGLLRCPWCEYEWVGVWLASMAHGRCPKCDVMFLFLAALSGKG